MILERNGFSKILIISGLVWFSQLIPHSLFAQNLVPNPGFDVLKECPTGVGQSALAEPWQWLQTPDLYHACATNMTLQTPSNLNCNYLPPHNGEGYVGLYVYNTREFVTVRLLDTLEAGKYYYASFYVAPDEDCSGEPQSYTDAIGLAVKGFGQNDNNEVKAENRGTILKDTVNWTKVSGCFQAKGNELFLQIGNFQDDDSTLLETDSPQLPNIQQYNYMFVDDVLLTPFDPFPDTVLLCNGQPVNLDASFYGADFQWLTGDTGAVLIAADTGTYIVTAKLDGCELTEAVKVVNLDYSSFNPPDTSICQGDELMLSPNIPGEYRWSDGATTRRTTARKSGVYEATINNSCGEFLFQQQVNLDDCRCRVFVPNVISPNGDGINDLVEIGIGCEFEYEIKHFEVFDRWGNSVFLTNDPMTVKWDGTHREKEAQQGVYAWFLSYDLKYEGRVRRILEEGDISVVK